MNFIVNGKDYHTEKTLTIAGLIKETRIDADIFIVNSFPVSSSYIINNNDVHTSNISPPYLLKDFSTNSVVGIVQNPGYLEYNTDENMRPTYNKYLNEEHIKNAVICEVVDELKLKSVANYNSTPYNMVMNVEGDKGRRNKWRSGNVCWCYGIGINVKVIW